ncbi:MAG: type II toxin-antitoxin system RelB/DinJ family antitoxin [Clostridia bacterium]|nr:type II toxin-antitoxin system RelB/DinJ family antitoxin [Clostridia bacterium]
MAQTNINIRIDEELKQKFDEFCTDVGMSMTTAFCIFAKKTVKEQKIPFEISNDPFYSTANIKRLEKSIKEAEEGKITVHEIIEVEDE